MTSLTKFIPQTPATVLDPDVNEKVQTHQCFSCNKMDWSVLGYSIVLNRFPPHKEVSLEMLCKHCGLKYTLEFKR